MNYDQVKNPEAQRFLRSFFMHREINQEFYRLVPEDQYDFKMTPKGDSIVRNLAHQIKVQRWYWRKAVGKTQKIEGETEKLQQKTKSELLQLLDQEDQKMVDLLSDEIAINKTFETKWSDKPVTVVQNYWGLYEHEILHTGIIICFMEHLNMPRFDKLKYFWG